MSIRDRPLTDQLLACSQCISHPQSLSVVRLSVCPSVCMSVCLSVACSAMRVVCRRLRCLSLVYWSFAAWFSSVFYTVTSSGGPPPYFDYLLTIRISRSSPSLPVQCLSNRAYPLHSSLSYSVHTSPSGTVPSRGYRRVITCKGSGVHLQRVTDVRESA